MIKMPVSRKEYDRVCNEYLVLEEKFKKLYIEHNIILKQKEEIIFLGLKAYQIDFLKKYYRAMTGKHSEDL